MRVNVQNTAFAAAETAHRLFGKVVSEMMRVVCIDETQQRIVRRSVFL